jgi:hypothetical protein
MAPPYVSRSDVPSRRGDAFPVMIWVQGQDNTEFTVVEKPEKLKVAITPVDDKPKANANNAPIVGRSYRMVVTIPPGTPPGEISDPIKLRTNHPKAEVVTVPVDILVVGGG